jgi:hypothetical protein
MTGWHEKISEKSGLYRDWHTGFLHKVFHWTAFVVVAGILSLAVLNQLPNQAAVDNVGSKNAPNYNWVAAAQTAKDGRVPAAGKILELNLNFDSSASPALSFTSATIKNGYLATVDPTAETDYKLQGLDQSGSVVSELRFVIPNQFSDPPPLGGEKPGTGGVIFKKSDFSLTLDYQTKIKSVQVVTEDDVVVASKDVSQEKSADNKADYQSLPGEVAVKTSAVSSASRGNALIPIAMAATNTLDITFIGDNYTTTTDLDLFHTDVNAFIANLLTYEPYKSRAGQILFHYVDNTASLGCAYDAQTARLLTCNNSNVTQKVNSSGVPYDKIVVIGNNSTYGGSGGSIAVAYNGSSGSQVFVHEFGHSQANLIDEYNLYTSNGSLDNKSHANCFAGTPPYSGWSTSVAALDYTVGCNYPNWYRPASGSVMISLGYHYFNSISQAMINNAITLYSAAYSDSSVPVSQIVSPLNSATVSGTVSLTTILSDNAGIARAELWKDSVLYRTSYVTPFGFSWPTTGETNGSHALVVKAYDVAGNTTASNSVTVTVNNAADTTAPTVSISSPANGASVAGTVTVTAGASDNSGAVSRVELYKDSVLLATDTVSPFSFSWDSIQDTNATHSLQAKAYDPSGNVGSSTVVSVTVANSTDTTAPAVMITNPLNGSKVPNKGTLKISASSSDASGISLIELLVDGVVVKTCSAVTSCAGSIQVSGLSAGTHVISAKATDIKGNTATTQVSVTK